MVELIDDVNYLVWDRFDGHSLIVPKDKVVYYVLKPYYFDSADEYMEYLYTKRGNYVNALKGVDWNTCFTK